MQDLIELAAGAFVLAPLIAVALWLVALGAAFLDSCQHETGRSD